MSVKDMMKYVLLNDEDIAKEGESHMVMKVLIHKYLDISPTNIETEFN